MSWKANATWIAKVNMADLRQQDQYCPLHKPRQSEMSVFVPLSPKLKLDGSCEEHIRVSIDKVRLSLRWHIQNKEIQP